MFPDAAPHSLPTVTVGLDESDASRAAADWAAREALLRELPLRVLLVRAIPQAPEPREPDYAALRTWADSSTRGEIGRLTLRYPGLRAVREQPTGVPAQVLTEASEQAELLVLGSRALGAVQGFLVGSVAQLTVARARCPVVLVRATADAPAPDPAGDVLVGLDLRHPAEDVLAFAFRAAELRGVPLRILTAWHLPHSYGLYPPVEPDFITREARDWTRRLSEAVRPWREKHPAVRVREIPAEGGAAQRLLAEAAEAALVVVGRRNRRSRTGAHIGPVAHALMHHAPAPLAVVPHD
ncbi:universal stress protein [Streptomyces sp. DSM 44917]|uniref:Universal stress protein n=1 Tax=Streptomyces boetiae TaxID=3075541 RepID=A0ABU2LDV9_9ACTN|nr:universal stress protein [Streptomyces sp. DSM 44917]MDT0309775.1 universal stress protein [Streptomyces sp. DSM 44917]